MEAGEFREVEVQRVVDDLLREPEAWTVVEAHADREAYVGTLTPALSHRKDGAAMPALVVPPPGEVQFRLEDLDAPAVLRARAGIDVTCARFLGPEFESVAADFEVLVNGEIRFQERVGLGEDGEVRGGLGTEWVDVGGEQGLLIEPGDVVALRTLAVDPNATSSGDEHFEPPVPIPVGFGGLVLERTETTPCVASSPSAPNIVLIVLDTLRADRLTCYGHGEPTSPRLDALAEEGLRFENAYATSSWTWPSTASILTGLQPDEHGVVDQRSCFLAHELVSLPEALQEAGLTTAAWSGNPLISPGRNFAQGFETFDVADRFRKSGEFFDDVDAWLRTRDGARFFLYLQLTDPHAPYVPLNEVKRRLAPDAPGELAEAYFEHQAELTAGADLDVLIAPETRRQYDELYDACVRSADHWVGRVVDLLDELELTDETLVVVTSDHGEEFFERGHLNHGHTVHAELVRAPLVLRGPRVPAGRTATEPVSNRHVAPTLARYAGLDLPAVGGGLDLLAEAPSGSVLFATETGHWRGRLGERIVGLRAGDFVLHSVPRTGHVQLFDVANDAGETIDLAEERPERRDQLARELERRLAALAARTDGGRAADGETLELLRRIGYLGDDE